MYTPLPPKLKYLFSRYGGFKIWYNLQSSKTTTFQNNYHICPTKKTTEEPDLAATFPIQITLYMLRDTRILVLIWKKRSMIQFDQHFLSYLSIQESKFSKSIHSFLSGNQYSVITKAKCFFLIKRHLYLNQNFHVFLL